MEVAVGMVTSTKDGWKKIKSLGKGALKGASYFCRESRKRERSWQDGCKEHSRGSSFGQKKEEEMASRPVRCFLCPVWEFTCSRKHQSPID